MNLCMSLSKSSSSFSSETVVSLSAAVFDEQVGQPGDQNETHHCGPDDDGNNSLVEVGPTLNLWRGRRRAKCRQEKEMDIVKTDKDLDLLLLKQ